MDVLCLPAMVIGKMNYIVIGKMNDCGYIRHIYPYLAMYFQSCGFLENKNKTSMDIQQKTVCNISSSQYILHFFMCCH